MKFNSQQKLQILRDIETNVALAYSRAIDIMDETLEKISEEKLKELKDKFEKVSEEMKNKVSVMKPKDGKDGATPQKFSDYFTPSEIAEIVSLATEKAKPKKGVDYRDGKDGTDGIGKDGYNGRDGKDGKDGSPDKPIELANKLNTLTEKVDKKVIRGLDKWMESIMASLRDRKKGGGVSGGGGGMGNVVPESFSIGSATTTITLANNVASNGRAIWFNYQGQQQAYGTHFTVSGKIITLLFTPQDSTFADIIYIRK